MSELIDCQKSFKLQPVFRLSEKIQISSTCEIPTMQVLAPFFLVMQAIERQMDKEDRSFDIGFPINCLFSDKDLFAIRLDREQVAACMKIAFFTMPKLEAYYGSKKLFAILAEELCHLIWEITDETLVCFKVFEVLQHIFPDLEIHQIYSQEIAAQYQRWVSDRPASQS